jgi:hypothetical protein
MGNYVSCRKIVPSFIAPSAIAIAIADDEIFGRSSQCYGLLKSSPYNFTSSDLKTFLRVFEAIDVDSNSIISITSVLRFFSIQCTPCNYKIFSHLKSDSQPLQYVSFVEFVVTIWNFLSLPMESIKMFIMSVFDIDESHCENPTALQQVINLIHFSDDEFDFEDRLEHTCDFENELSNSRRDVYPFNSKGNSALVSQCDDLAVLDGMLVTPIWSLQIRMCDVLFGKRYWSDKVIQRSQWPCSKAYNLRDTTSYLRKSVIQVLSQEKYLTRLRAKESDIHGRNFMARAIISRSRKTSFDKKIAVITSAGIMSVSRSSKRDVVVRLASDIRIDNRDEDDDDDSMKMVDLRDETF